MTMDDTESHASYLMHTERFPHAATPEIRVTLNVRFLPAFSAEMQMHLFPHPHDQVPPDDDSDRPQPAVVVPTTTSSISSGLSRVLPR